MKLYSTICVHIAEHDILEQPGVMARLRRAFGGNPNVSTKKMRAAVEAATLVDAHRRALAEVGATDAVALVIDDVVMFEDRDRVPDDLGDLFLTFHEYAVAIDGGFRRLRLTAEHREVGLHHVIELQARTEYPKGEAPVRVIVSARNEAFEPRPGETAERYRARVEPVLQDRGVFEIARVLFDSFVARIRDAIARAIPDARAEIVTPAPAPAPSAKRPRAPRPEDPHYDPHEAYYPNPMLGMFGMAMLGMALMPGFGDAADASDAADAGELATAAEGLFDFDW